LALLGSLAMLAILYTMLSAVRHSLRRRAALEAEILAPRHQLLVLQQSSATVDSGSPLRTGFSGCGCPDCGETGVPHC